MDITPMKDLLIFLRHKYRQMRENCYTRKDVLYCEGYKAALDDVIRGVFNIQDTFDVKYNVKKQTYEEIDQHDKNSI